MITNVRITKFKRFDEVEIELGRVSLFIGPNNLGKTTALQALSLWDVGLRRWNEKRKGGKGPQKRPGVTINRKDLTSLPVPAANLLWKDQHVREVQKKEKKQLTKNIRIDIIVSGVTNGKKWECGLEFDYANEESFYCRPLRLSEDKNAARMPIPEEAAQIGFAYLPPMSGLASNETLLQPGAINVRIGEGRTSEVLRNILYGIFTNTGAGSWSRLCEDMESLFGMQLEPPEYISERGEITMTYKEKGVRLDLSCSGRGAQQTMLLLAYLYDNPPGTVLLLDEPDAHLEILRQGQIYEILTRTAEGRGSQIVAASHSEKLLNEAAQRDVVIAFLGKPHRIDDRGSQVLKSLRDIGFEQYYQAEQKGWVLYLEGSTDMAILQTFARRLGHKAIDYLQQPFVHYVGTNIPKNAREHFYGLCEAKQDLVGIAIFDRIDKPLESGKPLVELMWSQREIENYLSQKETLLSFAESEVEKESPGPLFEPAERQRRTKAMEESIEEVTKAIEIVKRPRPFSMAEIKASEFLTPLFESFYNKLMLPNLMQKSNFHVLAEYVPEELIDNEITEKLDAIVGVAEKAVPRT